MDTYFTWDAQIYRWQKQRSCQNAISVTTRLRKNSSQITRRHCIRNCGGAIFVGTAIVIWTQHCANVDCCPEDYITGGCGTWMWCCPEDCITEGCGMWMWLVSWGSNLCQHSMSFMSSVMYQLRLLPGSERAGRRKKRILSRKVDATGPKPGGSTVGKQNLLAQPEPFRDSRVGKNSCHY